MDIDLFADIVRNLILDNDEVTLPGLGTFISEVMPSTFSDKGYTINPPYRRLSFRQREGGTDALLVDFYSQANGIERETSRKILAEFIAGLKETLQSKKLVVMPGLGRLRATKENVFFFIADEDLDIYPYGVGLEPVSLKTHEETSEEVSEAVKELQQIVEDPEPERLTFNFDTIARKKEGNKRRKLALTIILSVLGLAVLALGLFLLLAHIAPDFIDSLLYTPEELRIINYHPL